MNSGLSLVVAAMAQAAEAARGGYKPPRYGCGCSALAVVVVATAITLVSSLN